MKEAWWTAASRYLDRRSGSVSLPKSSSMEMEQASDSSGLVTPSSILRETNKKLEEMTLTQPAPVARPNPRRLPSGQCGSSRLRNEITPEDLESNPPDSSEKRVNEASLPLPVTEPTPQHSRWNPRHWNVRRWPSVMWDCRDAIFAATVAILLTLGGIGAVFAICVVHHRTKHAGDVHRWEGRAVVPAVEELQLFPSVAVTPEPSILAPSLSVSASATMTVTVTATAGATPHKSATSSVVRRTFLTSARLPTASATNGA